MTATLINETEFERVFRTPEQQQAEQIERAADAARCVGCAECEVADAIRREGE